MIGARYVTGPGRHKGGGSRFGGLDRAYSDYNQLRWSLYNSAEETSA